jgi:hypothetical protein
MSDKQPCIFLYVVLFAISYFAILAIVGYILLAAGCHPPSGLNTIFLIFAVSIVAFRFARKFGRPFSRSEYFKVLIGSVAFDVAVQFGVAIAIFGVAAFSGKWGAIVFVLFCHAGLLAVGYSSRIVRRYVRITT